MSEAIVIFFWVALIVVEVLGIIWFDIRKTNKNGGQK